VVVLIAALLELPYLVLMGTGSLLIWVLYLAGIRTAMKLEGEAPPESRERVRSDGGSFGLLILRFAAASGVIIAAGVLMVIWAEGTAAKTGWNTTFMGALFLALATSMPEASVVLSSFRIGAVDMALGNIFGSNAFNLAIIPLLDLVTPGVSIFRSFSGRNLLLAFSFAAVNVLAVAFLRSPRSVGARRRGFAFLLLALYLASIYGVYRLG
jgi:cation:H+ antiporter